MQKFGMRYFSNSRHRILVNDGETLDIKVSLHKKNKEREICFFRTIRKPGSAPRDVGTGSGFQRITNEYHTDQADADPDSKSVNR